MRSLGFTEADVSSMEAGRVATHAFEGGDEVELDVAAALHVRAPIERLLTDAPELWAVMAVGDLIQSGRFGEPPRPADIAGLVFEPRDLDGVADCEPRDCRVKLDQPGMRRVEQVDWLSAGARARFALLLKQSMLETVLAYQRDGSLPVYLDKQHPVSVAEELERSLSESPRPPGARSAFVRYLLDFPRTSLPGACDSFYWSTEKLRKPVTSLHHLVVQRAQDEGVVRVAIADKHLSDTHYFRSRLDLAWLLRGAGASDFYCVRLSLARIDPPGWPSGFLMGKIRSSTRRALEGSLDRARRRLEAQR